MRKIILFLSLFMLFLPTSFVSGSEEKERLILTFHDEIVEDIIVDEQVEVHHRFENYQAASVTVPTAMRKSLSEDKRVKMLEVDPLVTMKGQYINWGTEAVLANEAQASGLTGKGVKVGVVDTGIYSGHPDLVVSGGVSFIESEETYHDEDGHGTHVAGIIAARNNEFGMVGVAPGVELFAIKAIGANGTGYQSDIVKGIEWAVTQGLDIVNLSITTPQKSTIMEKSFLEAYERGLLIVAAAGNADAQVERDIDVLYPARFPSVIAVGSVGKSFDKSPFSYFGPSLEFVAPGEDVYSTYILTSGHESYALGSGTSMAAPYVTGIAALYKQEHPYATNKEIRTLMHDSALDLGEAGRDSLYGYGVVQAPRAERQLLFHDFDKDGWYGEEVAYLHEKEILTGYPDGYLYPEQFVTRAEAVTMLGKALNLDSYSRVTPYEDVEISHFASGYIASASAAAIIHGLPDGTFKPTMSITRADVAVILQNAFQFSYVSSKRYADMKEGPYYDEAVHALRGMNITTGYLDGTYRPLEKITRAEFSVLLARSLEESFRK